MPPAARIGDMHTCPMVDPGPKPHVGGPVSVGCPTVLIGFMPAARVGDMAVCVGPPDAIAKGSMTVVIGGQPAARIGDMTVHGGMVTVGCPTVFIGDVGMGGARGPVSASAEASALFGEQYLLDLVDYEITVSDRDHLRDAMNTLWEHRHSPSDGPDVVKALETVAEQSGQELNKIKADWETFKGLLAEQERIGAKNGQKPPPRLRRFHRRFMGSTSQLRSGKVVGDVLGIDPVFGALLNPTGGIVGPGNIGRDMDDSAVGYHGAVHDAAGYLYNYHDRGPGYDYLGTENRDTSSAHSGQRHGIRFWRNNLPDRSLRQRVGDTQVQGVTDYLYVPVVDGVTASRNVLSSAYKGAKDISSAAWDRLFR